MTLFLGLIIGVTVGVTITLVSNRQANRTREARARIAERRAADAERLAELGSLTSGLAHEIKNPLSTVILNAQLVDEAIRDLEAAEDQTAPILRRVDALVREADRLRTILTDFLRFAGRFQLDLQPTDLIREVEDVLDFFKMVAVVVFAGSRRIKGGVEFHLDDVAQIFFRVEFPFAQIA